MDQLVSLVAVLGWLVLVGSALASQRLRWRRLVRLALIWLAIFVGLFLVMLAIEPLTTPHSGRPDFT